MQEGEAVPRSGNRWGRFLWGIFNRPSTPTQVGRGGRRRPVVVYRKAAKSHMRALQGNRWISSMQLGLWDNTCGPRIDTVWSGVDEVSDEVRSYAVRLTLSAEIGQTSAQANALVDTKFHLFAELGYIITSTTFTALYDGSQTKFSFVAIVCKSRLKRYLRLHNVFEDRMSRLATILRALVHKQDSIEGFTDTYLTPFARNMDHLYHCSIPTPKLYHSVFAENPFDADFVARALTSHLQTHGSTVVVGQDVQRINMGIKGDVKCLKDEYVIHNILPTTVVDVQHMQVRQTHRCHEYTVLRREIIASEMSDVANPSQSESLWASKGDLFTPLKSVSPIVHRMVCDAFELPLALREGYLLQCGRALLKKAVTLIKCVEFELQTTKILEVAVLERIKADLECESEADLYVLLGIAEKLYPGVYLAMAGDPDSIELKFLELFESF